MIAQRGSWGIDKAPGQRKVVLDVLDASSFIFAAHYRHFCHTKNKYSPTIVIFNGSNVRESNSKGKN